MAAIPTKMATECPTTSTTVRPLPTPTRRMPTVMAKAMSATWMRRSRPPSKRGSPGWWPNRKQEGPGAAAPNSWRKPVWPWSNLEERAFELGYASPFDDAYPYKQNVVAGLDYLFRLARTYDGGTTICFARRDHATYWTGIAMMAIAASRAPNRVVGVAGSIVDGWTYKAVLQACVGFFAWSQNPDGGWRY